MSDEIPSLNVELEVDPEPWQSLTEQVIREYSQIVCERLQEIEGMSDDPEVRKEIKALRMDSEDFRDSVSEVFEEEEHAESD